MALGSLVIDLAANTAKFSSDMERAVQLAERGLKNIESGSEFARRALEAVGVALTVNAFVESIKHAAEYEDKLGEISEKSGILVEDLSAMRFAARQTDTDFDALADGLKKFRVTQTEASEGNKELIGLFGRLGVSVKDIDTLSQKDLFLKTIQGISELGKESERTTALTKLMGKSADDLGVFANQGAAGIQKLMQRAQDLGLVVDSQAVRATKAMNDNIKAMEDSAGKLSLTLLDKLSPHLQRITTDMLEASKNGGILDTVWSGLKSTVDELYQSFNKNDEFKSLNENIARLQEQLASNKSISDGGWFNKFLSGYDPDVFKADSDAIQKTIDELIAKRDKLLAAPQKPQAPSDDSSGDNKPLGSRTLAGLAEQQAATEKLAAAEEARKKKIADVVQQLERQSATVGESTAAAKVYELQQLKASDADVARAKSAQRLVDAYNEQQEAYKSQVELLERASQLREESLSPEERAVEALKDKYGELDNAVAKHLISRDEADKTKGGLSTNFMSSIDDSLKTDEERLKDSYDRRQLMLEKAHDDGLISEEKYQVTLNKLRDRYEADSISMRLQNAETLTSALAGIAEAAVGKQSGIYRVLFGVSKAFALADSIVKIQTGIANAAALPFPTNLGAMASVAAATGSILTTIKSTQLGQAHGGLDYVPEDATYILKQGERVLAPKQNQDLSKYLANGGGGLTVNIIEDSSRGGQVRQNGDQVDVFVAKVREAITADVVRGGNNLSRALEGTYALNRGAGARR